MKSDFKVRPMYLTLSEHIESYFLTHFISLIQILVGKLNNKYQVTKILKMLRDMELIVTQYNDDIPAYKSTPLTDGLHEVFKFRKNYEIISKKKMRNIIKNTK